MQCVICGKPRDGCRLWCGDEACLQACLALPVEYLNAIREREAVEAMRPAPADGRGVYIHMTPRED